MKLGFKKKIEVTKADIAKAGVGAYDCPVAVALRRTFKPSKGETVCVGSDSINIGYWDFPTPKTVKQFIKAFDGNVGKSKAKPLHPFSFILEA